MMSPPVWLIDYYSSVADVVSPACGLAVAVAALVLVSMYRDAADAVAVRVSGVLGLANALLHISRLIARELSLRPEPPPEAAARILAFTTHLLQLLSVFLANRIALDLQINFLGWFACSCSLRWVLAHYVRATLALATVLASPLLFAHARFDPELLLPQWTFGSTVRNVLFLAFAFYVWVLLLLLSFALLIAVVIARLRRHPSDVPAQSLATPVMRDLDRHMRRKARILVLYPLSPLVFYAPALALYWIQALHLQHTRATRIIWATWIVMAPLQAIFDFAVFVLLPPVRRVLRWHCVLHKDSHEVPLIAGTRRESVFASTFLSSQHTWVQDVADHPHPPI